tara:strand:+ start:577 stop:1005 length:429 start_codon:yes stop_codon:yes gene_type:complete
MILFDLNCENDHKFEAWFPSNSKYEAQLKKKLINCPICDTSKVKKSLMAPNINLSNSAKKPKNVKKNKEKNNLEKQITKFKRFIEKNTENVGKNFAEEARKIYYGEKKSRPIRGETTANEAKDLSEEGIPFSKLPWSSREDA